MRSNLKKIVFRYLKDKIAKDDVLFFNINTGITPFTYHYGESAQAYALSNLSRTIELANGRKSVWLVSTLAKISDPKGSIKKYFDNSYKLVEKKEFFDVTVYHYIK